MYLAEVLNLLQVMLVIISLRSANLYFIFLKEECVCMCVCVLCAHVYMCICMCVSVFKQVFDLSTLKSKRVLCEEFFFCLLPYSL